MFLAGPNKLNYLFHMADETRSHASLRASLNLLLSPSTTPGAWNISNWRPVEQYAKVIIVNTRLPTFLSILQMNVYNVQVEK
jgi:hypothetical protein